MDPTAMMNPMGFGPGMVGGMGPGFGVGPRGGFGEKVFPVVRLRGLPFNAGEFDILEFFLDARLELQGRDLQQLHQLNLLGTQFLEKLLL